MRLEAKPAGIVVHVRGADPAVGERVLAAVRSGPARLPGVESTEGKAVLEMAVVQVSKGAAIDTLRGRLGADAVLFVGDDVTDETAFVRLRPGDVGIKVGEGDTAAGYRVGTPEDVTAVLEQLLAARRERPGRRPHARARRRRRAGPAGASLCPARSQQVCPNDRVGRSLQPREPAFGAARGAARAAHPQLGRAA